MAKVVEATIIKTQIDKYWEDHQEDGRRHHLGGSLIGRECLRELWYSFRWATNTRHSGRILRLFNRGHHEEPRLIEWLQQIGVEVREFSERLLWASETDAYQAIDWDKDWHGAEDIGLPRQRDVTAVPYHVARAKKRGVKLEQWRIKDVDGHFGGSLDGIAYNVPGVDQFGLGPEDPVLLEFKTHGQKSFDQLTKQGIEQAKAEHVAQMQVYMAKRGIKLALYMPICKNTDELHPLFLPADNMAGVFNIDKAAEIISSPTHPNRISNNPSWYKCRFCDHRRTCHLGDPMEKNCRTCQFSKPIEDGDWYCAKWENVIPKEAQKQGCDAHHMITD